MKPSRKHIRIQTLTIITAILVAVLLALVGVLIFLEVNRNNAPSGDTGNANTTGHAGNIDNTNHIAVGSLPRPWEQPGAKQPEDYTWEEFLALPAELQIAFQFAFDSSITFDEWMNRVQATEPEQIDCPWDQPGAKQPPDYTWEEFLALSAGQQHAFQFAFDSTDAFDAWLNRALSAEPEQIERPWEQPGAKQPNDYTWDEFLALSPDMQIAFQRAFGSSANFEAWMNRVQSAGPEHFECPWEQPSTKQPNDYTWDEFLALSPELQIAFQRAFGSSANFEAWMNRVQSAGPEHFECPWDQPGAKQPKDYTWDEFLALPAELQIAFQFAFDSSMSFEEWMNQKMPKP